MNVQNSLLFSSTPYFELASPSIGSLLCGKRHMWYPCKRQKQVWSEQQLTHPINNGHGQVVGNHNVQTGVQVLGGKETAE